MKTASTVILLILVALGISSCKKGYDPVPDDLETAYLNVVNGTADTLNFYLKGTRQNSTSSIYPAGSSTYLTVTAGNQTYDFRKYLSPATLFTTSVNLQASNTTDRILYSLFIGGQTADKIFYQIDTLKDIKPVNSSNSMVRFVHTSGTAPAIDVMLDSSSGFTNRSFKSVSPFTEFASGVKTVNIYAAGTSVILATQKFTLATGSIYTLYIKGTPGGKGDAALSMGIFINQ